MAYERKILNDTRHMVEDRAVGQIKASIGKYLLSVILVVVLYLTFNFFYPHQIEALVLLGVVIVANGVFYFYDDSLKLYSVKLKQKIRKVNMLQLKTYVVHVDTEQERLVPVQTRSGSDPLQNGNVILFQNLATSQITGLMGVSLDAVALQLKPNYKDFLRKIYELQHTFPISIQISLKNTAPEASDRVAEKTLLFTNAQVESPYSSFAGDATSFQYHIFFSRSLETLALKDISAMVIKMRQVYRDFLNVLETNFAHFKFSPLEEEALVDAIRGSFLDRAYRGAGAAASKKNPLIKSKIARLEKLPLWGKTFTVILLNWLFLEGLGYLIFSRGGSPHFLIIGGVYLSGAILRFVSKYRQSFALFKQQKAKTVVEIDLFPEGFFVADSKMEHMAFYNRLDERLHLTSHYSLGAMNYHFIFNSVKLFRPLMTRVVNSPYSVSIQYQYQRVGPGHINRYKDFFTPSFMKLWTEKSDRHMAIARSVCGFYSFQPLISLSVSAGVSFSRLSDTVFANLQNKMEENFLHILRYSFPQSELAKLPSKSFYMGLAKTHHYSKFGTGFPLHILPGLSLEKFIQIPEEIHKYLTIFYPGEFSAPFLNDDILLGASFNAENNQFEMPGGITEKELKANVLIAGNFYEELHRATLKVAGQLLKHRIPCIFFDWDGTAKHLDGQLRHFHKSAKIRTYEVGENLGLALFKVPDLTGGPYEVIYLEKIITVLAQTFDFSEAESSMLRTSLTSDMGLGGEINLQNLYSIIDGVYGDNARYQKYRSALYSFLKKWEKDFLKSSFDRPLDSYLPTEVLMDPQTSFVINLKGIGETRLKVLFIQSFLLQILTLQEKLGQSVPKAIFLPALENISPERNRANTYNTILEDLTHHGNIFIGETARLSEVHRKTVQIFENQFIFRTKHDNDLRLLYNLLNLDSFYTNTSAKGAGRKASYQKQVLMTLPADKCIVFREDYAQPYIFSFAFDYFSAENLAEVNRENYGFVTQAPAHEVSPQLLGEATKLSIEMDLHTHIPCLPGIIRVLGSVALYHDRGERVHGEVIRNELKSALNNHFDRIGMNMYQRTAEINTIFEDLTRFGYISQETSTLANDIEYVSFEITEKGLESVRDYTNLQKLKESGVEASSESGGGLEDIGGGSSTITREVIGKELADQLPVDALTEIRDAFPEAIIRAKAACRQEDYDGCKTILGDKCREIVSIARNFPGGDDFLTRAAENLLSLLESTSGSALFGVINEIEDFMVEV